MTSANETPTTVHRLRCEYLKNPLGLGVKAPRLSWELLAERRGCRQTAYQLQVAESSENLKAGSELLWDSGKVESDESIHRVYGGPELRSRQRGFWRVRVWDEYEMPSEWSDAAFWEMGLLETSDWRAAWIEPGWDENPEEQNPAPFLRGAFEVDGEVASARLYATAHGVYELTLNGRAADDRVFAPGFTSYGKRLEYQTYDVTDLLRQGENAVGVVLGDGWFRGKVSVSSVRNLYGSRLALLLQLHLTYADGREQVVCSEDGLRSSTGPILMSDMKDGEAYDARLEQEGWDEPGFDASGWHGVRVVGLPKEHLVAASAPPVRRREEFRPVEILHTPNGETVVDMGQNFAGRLRLRVRGPRGTRISLQHGETLDGEGNFTMENLKFLRNEPPAQTVSYTLKGTGEEVYEPHFTFHGFRYVRVEGFPGTSTEENFTGVALYSDLEEIGDFECSNPLINRLQKNILWSQKSNFLEIPTDCPQRERAGWTGDAQLFARTGSFNLQTAPFFVRWLKDLEADQRPDGKVTNLVPDTFPKGEDGSPGFFGRLDGSAGWGDAAAIVPWTLYERYGDLGALEQQYESMRAWVEYEISRAREHHWTRRLQPAHHRDRAVRERRKYLWDTNYHWGEWLEPGKSLAGILGDILHGLILSRPLVASAYLSHSVEIMARTARLLGKEADAERYEDLHTKIKRAYAGEFIGPDGSMQPDRQASYVRALAFDLVPEELRPAVVERLVALVRANGDHLGTGFLSTPFLCHVLADNGYLDVAYDLLEQTTRPSWLYAVTRGATTIWELWDGVKEDGSVGGSLNHYAYGAVGSFLYEVVAGIAPDPEHPGYKHFVIHPRPGGSLTHARASHRSPYGEISVSWKLENGRMSLEIGVPPNTTAMVRLPEATLEDVRESGSSLRNTEGLEDARQEGSEVVATAVSGSYRFEYPTRT